MNNVNAILELWIKLFYGSQSNYENWLAEANSFLESNHFPYWVMDVINALPYIMTILSFVFVFYFFYLLVRLFKGLINLVNDDDTDDDGTTSNAGGTTRDKVKTYYYFSKKPGRKKKHRYDD